MPKKSRNEFGKLPRNAANIGVLSQAKENYALNTHFWSKILGRYAFLLGSYESR
jgi:hypothetical protein